jgi:chorismate dehydratase
MSPAHPIRLSAVSFLNAAPLVYALRYGERPPWLDVDFQEPARCADALRRGVVDGALLPVVECVRIPGLLVVPGMAIGSPGPVRSVVLASRSALADVRQVWLSPHSRTSVALVQVLLKRRLPAQPAMAVREMVPAALGPGEAALIIGDQALTGVTAGVEVHDLATMWRELTGRPFVFAVWAVRRAACRPELVRYLAASKAEGLRRIDEIAADFSGRLGRPVPELRRYLTENLTYDLGADERASIRLFLELCREDGLVDSDAELEMADGS